MNIVTAADSGFFHCLMELTKSVKTYYGKPAIVYDLGLTDKQKKQLDATIIPLTIANKLNYKSHCLLSPSGEPVIRATHKPSCVNHYFKNYSEPMIFVDADCLFMAKVEEKGFDVGITCYKNKKHISCNNGIINSGVIFFNSHAKELVNLWEEECEKENTTDQKALSDILSQSINWNKFNKIQDWNELKIKVFNAKKYNNYHLTKHGKILHFVASKHKSPYYEQLLEGLKQGKNIRKMFNRIKRGKKSPLERISLFLGIKKT